MNLLVRFCLVCHAVLLAAGMLLEASYMEQKKAAMAVSVDI